MLGLSTQKIIKFNVKKGKIIAVVNNNKIVSVKKKKLVKDQQNSNYIRPNQNDTMENNAQNAKYKYIINIKY